MANGNISWYTLDKLVSLINIFLIFLIFLIPFCGQHHFRRAQITAFSPVAALLRRAVVMFIHPRLYLAFIGFSVRISACCLFIYYQLQCNNKNILVHSLNQHFNMTWFTCRNTLYNNINTIFLITEHALQLPLLFQF